MLKIVTERTARGKASHVSTHVSLFDDEVVIKKATRRACHHALDIKGDLAGRVVLELTTQDIQDLIEELGELQ